MTQPAAPGLQRSSWRPFSEAWHATQLLIWLPRAGGMGSRQNKQEQRTLLAAPPGLGCHRQPEHHHGGIAQRIFTQRARVAPPSFN